MVNIQEEHPEYRATRSFRKRYRDLYAGGEQFRANAAEYLLRRQREPNDVYGERLERVFYENYIGSIVDWYAATLFRREPVVSFSGENEMGRRFFGEFMDDADLKGSSWTDFFRGRFIDALVQGCSYVLLDFPRAEGPVGNRAEEDARGISRAYLVEYSAEDLINWGHDGRGNFEWVVLRRTVSQRTGDGRAVLENRWTYYDKERFEVYRQFQEGAKPGGVELVDSGVHALAAQRRVPLFELRLSEGLWLMNKAALLQLEHFNKSNALSWALTMGLFAMPVVYTERQWNQIVGESYFVQLGPQDRFGWTEPEGKVFQIAADNLNRLKDEIYRVCYLLGQAAAPASAPQSGLSKQRDFAITQEVLRAYGDAVKDVMRRVLRAVNAAREDGLQIDVSGLDEFDIGDFSTELADAERLLALNPASKTFRRAVLKKLAFKYLCDVRQEMKDKIAAEIDESIGD